jgi:hypothetical protein
MQVIGDAKYQNLARHCEWCVNITKQSYEKVPFQITWKIASSTLRASSQ